ncbi:MAG TPA: hypothetical protein VFT62_09500 [Mycobacteriales bacterium]|nr:hypothetical protein [Mycobacteriales bacterium]
MPSTGIGGRRGTTARGLLSRVATVTVVAATVAIVPAVGASAAPQPATYSATVSPTTAAAGSVGTFTVTFVVDRAPSTTDLVKQLTVSFDGFTGLSGPSAVTDSRGGSWNVSYGGGDCGCVVSMSSNPGLVPSRGQSVSVPVTATAPSSAGSYPLATTATGIFGPFALDGGEATITVTAVVTHLAFTVQPTSTTIGTPFSPTVEVAAEDAANNVVTSFSGQVQLSVANQPPDSATPTTLPRSVDAVNGVATFSGLALDAAGYGWTLSASVPGSTSIAGATSNAFDITQALVNCAAGQTCKTPTEGDSSISQAQVTTQSGGADVVSLTVGSGVVPPACAEDAPGFGQPARYDTQATDRTITITLRLDKSQVEVSTDNGASKYSICYEAKQQFARSAPDGEQYSGLLAPCSASNPAPCVQKLSKNGKGDEVAVISALPGDPRTIWHG